MTAATRSSTRRAALPMKSQETVDSHPSQGKGPVSTPLLGASKARAMQETTPPRRITRSSSQKKTVISTGLSGLLEAPTPSLKRSADTSDELPKMKLAKRSRSQTKKAVNKTLPADVLPHGLGKIHSSKSEGASTAEVAGTLLLPSLATAGNTSDIGSSDDIMPFLSSVVQEIIEKAVYGVLGIPENAAQTLLGETTSSRQLRTRKTSQPPQHPQAIEISKKKKKKDETQKAVDKAKQKREPRRTKDNPYGLMPGRTPFPDWAGPTPDECREVHRLLKELHGEFQMPQKIPAPSTTVAGCGEVPDLVDALIRTLISGHTSMSNANLAIQDVIAEYGQWSAESIGAGSIDWNKVRISEEAEIVQAIKRAGLGPTKGKDIKLILEQVYQENQKRQAEYLREIATGETCGASGAGELTEGQKQHQLLKIQSGVLTLDHIRGMTPDEAMLEFTKYPGIGVKTAACLILFCLQQPSFAVDTHVWRFCKWLKWVPPKATRDDTYMHGEVRIPDDLKYGLHQLFIRHGKECGRCRSGTVEGTAEWEGIVCPLEHLLDRFDKRKSKVKVKRSTKTKGTARDAGGFSDDDED